MMSGKIQSIQLHRFSDSSESAYAATVYLYVKTEADVSDSSESAYAAKVYLCVKTEADVRTRFLSSKSKVAPISGEITLRLELLSALLLSRLFTSVERALREAIQIEKRFCWFDSMAAFFQIKSIEG